MPRQSAESRSAAVWREGGSHPQPPKHLSCEAKAVWREIVECRPVDFFQPGSLHLLEQFCVATVAARRVAELVDADPVEVAAAYATYMTKCAGTPRSCVSASSRRYGRKAARTTRSSRW